MPLIYSILWFQCGGKNIRFVVMNNLLPSSIKIHEKYDLKGSTYKRKASKREQKKNNPTWKDLDFVELHADGIMLEADTHSALIKTIERDCRVGLIIVFMELNSGMRERHLLIVIIHVCLDTRIDV